MFVGQITTRHKRKVGDLGKGPYLLAFYDPKDCYTDPDGILLPRIWVTVRNLEMHLCGSFIHGWAKLDGKWFASQGFMGRDGLPMYFQHLVQITEGRKRDLGCWKYVKMDACQMDVFKQTLLTQMPETLTSLYWQSEGLSNTQPEVVQQIKQWAADNVETLQRRRRRKKTNA